MKVETLLTRAALAERESKQLDFKVSFDVNSNGDWCEVIKDIVAMANSGGGIIVFGVANDGTMTGFDRQVLLGYDPAKVTDKIARYTARQFADFEIRSVTRDGGGAASLLIHDAVMPMIFAKAGTYLGSDGKEKTAFQNGTLYVRHGAKSEPATAEDLLALIDREVDRRRRTWLRNIRKVVEG
jgi:predicted HTH transcriptional regulator